MRIVIRILGGFLGVIFIMMGLYLTAFEGKVLDKLYYTNMIIIGALFLRYSIKGYVSLYPFNSPLKRSQS